MAASGKNILSVLLASYGDLLRHLTHRLGSASDAQDLAQETFLKTQRMGSDAHVQNPRSYLFRIADNLAIDHIRQKSQKNLYITDVEDADAPANTPSQEETVDYRQRFQILRRAIAELPPRQRLAFHLHKVEGLSYTEVGERMGIGRSAVEKLIRKAFAHCRDQLDDLLD